MPASDVQALPLTKKERVFLDQLIAANGGVVTRDAIFAATNVRERDAASFSNPQDVLVSRVRKKLVTAGVQVAIRTVRGRGYRLDRIGGEA